MAIYVVTNKDGSKHYKAVVKNKHTTKRQSVGTFTNRRAAERAQAAAYKEIDATGQVASFKPMTVSQLVELHLSAKSAKVRPKTVASYRRYLTHFMNFVGADTLVSQIGVEQMEAFVAYLDGTLKMAPLTVNLVVQNVGSLMKTGEKYHYVNENPVRHVGNKPKRRRQKDVRALSIKEHEALVRAIGSDYYTLARVWPFIGGRPAEMYGLQVGDFNAETGTLRICRQYQQAQWLDHLKHDARPRTIKLDHGTVELLQSHVSGLGEVPPETPLFRSRTGGPINQAYFAGRVFKPAVAKAKIVGDVTPHSLRHTCATWLLESQASPMYVAKHLGHSSPQITMEVYASLLEEVDAMAGDRLARWHEGMAKATGVTKRAGNTEDLPLEAWEIPSDEELAANQAADRFREQFRNENVELLIAAAEEEQDDGFDAPWEGDFDSEPVGQGCPDEKVIELDSAVGLQPSTTKVQRQTVGEG